VRTIQLHQPAPVPARAVPGRAARGRGPSAQLERGPGQRHPGRHGLARRRPPAARAALGAGAALGQGPQRGQQDDQPPGRDRAREEGLEEHPGPQALHHPHRRLLRVAGPGQGPAQAALLHHLPRLQPARPGRAVGDLARPVGRQGRAGRGRRRRRAVDLHHPDDRGQPPDGVGAPPHAGDPAPRGLGHLARPGQHRHRRAGQAAGAGPRGDADPLAGRPGGGQRPQQPPRAPGAPGGPPAHHRRGP
jgi:hypothetical protein